ncbi:MAG: type VI secretion system tip protein VgrG [Polyangiaceae bacterium]|nr:type VI secretion system tip protein VgrG [Polyangiaceae bacterium]
MPTQEVQRPRLLQVEVASGDQLDIRHFSIHERMNQLFGIGLRVVSDNSDINFDQVVGQPAGLTIRSAHHERRFTGIVSRFRQVGVEDHGLSTYELEIVPALWLLTQRRNHRVFQHKSELDIVRDLLAEWKIPYVERLSDNYPKRKYRVQYGESDFAFCSRMLEDAGVSFYFELVDGETQLVLHDAPQSNSLRLPPIPYRENPSDGDLEHVTQVNIERKVRPGKYTVRDHDYRRPASYKLLASSENGLNVESKLERFHYVPGSFLFETDKGEATPSADDKGRYRTVEPEGAKIAQKRLDAKRAVARSISFQTNAIDLSPGAVVSFLDHPKSEVSPSKRLLVLASQFEGTHSGDWAHSIESVRAELPYRPPLVTAKPRVLGVESATVVGPPGEEISTDEFGRVRVHFHWDRESRMDDNSSCWIHVSQPWGGTGFGGTNLPRIGQEVIVDFLGGDPDRPIVIGRVYTNLTKTPYRLPDNKTQSGWRSRSSPGGSGDNYNEIMFEDKKGQELLRMQAEKDLNKLVKNDEEATVGHDRKRNVGNDETLSIGNNRTRTVGVNETVLVGNDRSKTIGANEAIGIGMNQLLAIGANQATRIGESQDTKIGKNQTVEIGKELKINVGEVIEIVCGKSVLRMDKEGNVTINGTKFNFEASGHVQVSGELIDLN